jgi:hypothetical protein
MKKLLIIAYLIFFFISINFSIAVSLNNGLFSFYKLEYDGNDSIGNLDFQFNDDVTFISGRVNNGALFNNITDTLNLSTSSLPFNTTTTGITICLWINNSINNNYQRALIIDDSTANNKLGFQYRLDPAKFLKGWKSIAGTGEDIVDTGINHSSMIWNYVCIISNSSGLYTFHDGNYISSGTVTKDMSPSFNRIQLGFDTDATGEYFNGMIDEIGIWNRTLPISDIVALYNNLSIGNTYPFPLCIENWVLLYSDCIYGRKFLIYNDIANCNTYNYLPNINNTYGECAIPASKGEENITNVLYLIVILILIIIIFIYKIYGEDKND